MDFLKWRKPLDLVLMLNPFVTKTPLMAWGLPLRHYAPAKLFSHAYERLKNQNGVMLLSSPFEDEFEIAKELALNAGFGLGEEGTWHFSETTFQKQSRYGVVCYTRAKGE
jgi:hypothetical protein